MYRPLRRHFSIPDSVHLHAACSVAVDSRDNVYCFNRGNVPLLTFDPSGERMQDRWTGKREDFVKPHSVKVDPDGNLWLVDVGAHTVTKCTVHGERLLMLLPNKKTITRDFGPYIGKPHSPSLPQSGVPFNMPTNVAVAGGRAFITDGYANSSVHVYHSRTGEYLQSWGTSGTAYGGEFNLPHDICVSPSNLLVVADRENHRIQTFTLDGEPVSQWHVHRPCGICFHGPLLYVCQLGPSSVPGVRGPRIGNCVTVHEANGQIRTRIGTDYGKDEADSFLEPHGIAVDSRGNMFTANVAEHIVKKPVCLTLKAFSPVLKVSQNAWVSTSRRSGT